MPTSPFADRIASTPPGDWRDEYRAVKTAAALFDCSDRGKIEVTGPEAPSFLSNLSTNDIANLPLGGGCLTYFLNPRARVLFQAIAYHVLLDGTRHAILLDVTPGHHEGLLRHLDRHLISEAVELADRTAAMGQLHVAGPQAKAVIERAFGQAISDMTEYLHLERAIVPGVVCQIRRHDPLGVAGYDIVCRAEDASVVWDALTNAGAVPAGTHPYEVLRIEAATPVFGTDIDDNRFVMEVGGALKAVCYTKGCFVGQEPIVMSRDRAGFVNRAFLKLFLRDGEPLPAGTKLFHGDEDVGLVTSSIESPNQGVIALAYVRRGHQEPGLILTAKLPEGDREAEVLPTSR